MGTFLLGKMSLNVITVKLFLYNSKNKFLENLYSGTHRGGFQFLLILDLWGISFHAVVVFGLGKNLLFKSVLGRCGVLHRQRKSGRISVQRCILSAYITKGSRMHNVRFPL